MLLPWIALAARMLAACGSGESPDSGRGARLVDAAGSGDAGEVRRLLGAGGPAHRRIVALLVGAGADTAIADRDGVTALEHARRRGFGEIARILARA